MREIETHSITEAVKQLCMDANYYLPDDVVNALQEARTKEISEVGKAVFDEIFENIKIAREEQFPLCQDCGTSIFAIELGQDVHITGYIDEGDKPAVYRGAAVLVQLSHYEGFGLTPLEAMSCGTPVVASDRSSLPEVVGAAGFTLDPADVEGIAGAIIACAIQENLRADLRQRGLEQAARFSWRRTAEETLQVLRRAAS